MGLFLNRPQLPSGKPGVPVWFMRQAGRYHAHYQAIKAKSSFMEMCKDPQLACDVTMGPIEEFKFDAAILFSDLLFPLEHLGLGLTYDPGPKLARHLDSLATIKGLKTLAPAEEFYRFQGQACVKLRSKLPSNVDLLGFVGSPFTLYTYAVEGSHSGAMVASKLGLYDGRFASFMEKLLPELLIEMSIQAQSGIQAICLFDTAAGELTIKDYKEYVVPQIRWVCREFKKKFPEVKIIYYSKFTHLAHLHTLECKEIDVLGVDWRHDLNAVFKEFSKDYYIQGNFDPAWLHLSWNDCRSNLEIFYRNLADSGANLNRWIMGLGHGVLIETPQENVKRTVEFVHTHFHC